MKINKSNFRVLLITQDFTLLEDVGPHDEWLTITNCVESVVVDLLVRGQLKRGQRLFYIDSMNQMDEIEFNILDGFQRFTSLQENDDVANVCLSAWNQMKKHKS